MDRSAIIYTVVILVLLLVLGYLLGMLYEKRRSDIIKLLIKQDLLPEAAENTRWIQGGTCYMADGNFGKVNGRYCQQIVVL